MLDHFFDQDLFSLQSAAEIARLKKLRVLDISANFDLDADLSALTQVEELDIGHLGRTSAPLKGLNRLVNLKHLRLSGHTLPSDMKSFRALEKIAIDGEADSLGPLKALSNLRICTFGTLRTDFCKQAGSFENSSP